MGWFQPAWPLWAAMISFSRQIGLLGAFHSVSGTGLGDQLYQIFGASWARAGTMARTRAPAPSKKRCSVIRSLPKPVFFLGKECPRRARKTTAQDATNRYSIRLDTSLAGVAL